MKTSIQIAILFFVSQSVFAKIDTIPNPHLHVEGKAVIDGNTFIDGRLTLDQFSGHEIDENTIPDDRLEQMASGYIKGNISGNPANVGNISVSDLLGLMGVQAIEYPNIDALSAATHPSPTIGTIVRIREYEDGYGVPFHMKIVETAPSHDLKTTSNGGTVHWAIYEFSYHASMWGVHDSATAEQNTGRLRSTYGKNCF